jgi:hypothetical protein
VVAKNPNYTLPTKANANTEKYVVPWATQSDIEWTTRPAQPKEKLNAKWEVVADKSQQYKIETMTPESIDTSWLESAFSGIEWWQQAAAWISNRMKSIYW